MKKEYRNFKDAKTFVHSLNLKSQKEWSMYCKSGNKPDNIPADPRTHYKNKGWKNSGDWLGTGTIASYNIKFKSFASARKFAHSLNLKSYDQWIGYTKSGNKPDDLPAYPMRTYRKKGWNGMSDWLANGRSNKLKSFTEAKKFVQKLKFTNRDDWVKYCKSGKKPIDIPKSPSAVYKKEWQGWGDWLDSGFIATQKRKYDSFTDAKKLVQKLKLKNSTEWNDIFVYLDKQNQFLTNHPNLTIRYFCKFFEEMQ